MVLLVGAGLMLRSVVELQEVDPGFDPEQVLGATLDLNFSKYTSNELIQQFHQRLRRLAAQPGIQLVASSRGYPLDGRRAFGFDFMIERRPPGIPGAQPQADFRGRQPGLLPGPRDPPGDRPPVHRSGRAQGALGGHHQSVDGSALLAQ